MLSRQATLTISYLSILLISCVSGTHYLFSAYSTSIQERLDFSSVQINTIGSACNYGVYLGKPFLGYLVDNHSARRVCFASSALIFFGFSFLALTYERLLPPSFILCAFYLLCTGVASSGGTLFHYDLSAVAFLSIIVSTAISIPLALLGLSAFLYSQANIYLFERTFHFLLFIAFSAGLTMFFGSLFLIVVPTPSHVSTAIESGSDNSIPVDSDPSHVKGLTTEQTPLLNKNSSTSHIIVEDNEPDIGGWQLLHNKDAISLILILVLLAGTGLMYINNVGTIIETLYHASPAHPSHPYSLPTSLNSDIKKLQTKNSFNLSRICSLVFAGVWLFCGNLLALLWVHDMNQLWIVTTCIGLGFGILYGVAPTTCSEYFALGAQGFNLLFGYNNDFHRDHCKGAECYNFAFYFSSIGCFISIYIAYRWFTKVQKQREHIEH
ncbi:45044_t:CDS:2 [Gigaspora margarita]|uniref:45044_t:CDS:1 n=1 Tax=Gigaspora margarita TaxID=4874 RepID=A0ABN7UZJ3_GIGMA|nr:45044_t:CDS:2 [Gigaspora margarita]